VVIVLVRALVIASGAAAGLALGPAFGRPAADPWLLAVGVGLGILAVLLEQRARLIPVERLFWGAAGALAGSALGFGVGSGLGALVPAGAAAAGGLLALLGAYLGVVTTLAKEGDLAGLSARLFPRLPPSAGGHKILDTSVIIDGRVVDVCGAGFLEGTLLVPRFVLRELQQIADSSDGLRRNRGKRGFEVLQRLQRLPGVTVLIDERDFHEVREVDQKLIELARAVRGKVVTNDYNLNKVAELSGVPVLNVNELANALKPVALPGETMHLHVLREGKEAGQGVAYLDDGTMVVVDHGRKLIGQDVAVTVTSVLQTPAGRMIFARPAPSEEQAQRS
jgi:uncharacterized protein YacL